MSEMTILLYHGVTDKPSRGIENASKKHIELNDFRKQMGYLNSHCHVLSVDEYLSIRESQETLPPNSVIVSFDDGFENNFSVAAPVLDELQLPAVFYIASGIVNTNLMFWVDIIEDCINMSANRNIDIQLNERQGFSLDSDSHKLRALDVIKSYCKNHSNREKERVISELEAETGVVADASHASNYAKITWRQLSKMNENSLFTIGGHSLYHNILSSLDLFEKKLEIRASLDLLALNLGMAVRHYSYPEGQENHYDDQTIEILKLSGIRCCPSAIAGLNSLETDPFHLRRIMVGFCGLPFPYWT